MGHMEFFPYVCVSELVLIPLMKQKHMCGFKQIGSHVKSILGTSYILFWGNSKNQSVKKELIKYGLSQVVVWVISV